MTLGVQTIRALYSGDDVTTGFAIPFNYYANTAYVLVYKLATDGTTITLLTYGVDYTISSQTLTASAAPATGEKLLIISALTLLQGLSLSDQTSFLPSSVMVQMDHITAMLQQLEERINRCFTMPLTSTVTRPAVDSMTIPVSSVIGTDSSAALTFIGRAEFVGPTGANGANGTNGTNGADGATGPTGPSAGTYIQDSFGGTLGGTITSPILSQAPKAPAGVLGFMGTLFLIQNTHYTISGKNITMLVTPDSDQPPTFCYFF